MLLGRRDDTGSLLLFIVLAGLLGDTRRDDSLLVLLLFLLLFLLGDFKPKK